MESDISEDKANMIAAAIVLGFVDIGDNRLMCTKDQLFALMCVVANEAITQALNEGSK